MKSRCLINRDSAAPCQGHVTTEAGDATAPITRTTDAADLLRDVRVADPYRWLDAAGGRLFAVSLC
jgi:hypothetical protein